MKRLEAVYFAAEELLDTLELSIDHLTVDGIRFDLTDISHTIFEYKEILTSEEPPCQS